jgi:starch-binding outer membrane protein, SusD/RagB family
MKNNIIRLAFFISTLLCLNSCSENDLLDKYPKDAPIAAKFFIDASTARKADVAIFTNWATFYMYQDYMMTFLDVMSDDSYTRLNNAWRIAANSWDFAASGSIQDNLFNNWWTSIYASINDANFAIDNIPNSSDVRFTPELQKPYIGVAKMMRAFAYIYLTTLWGDVPLHRNFINTSAETYVAKSPKSEILALVIDDLTYAAENIPESWSGDDTGLPTKAAAAGLLARAYLYAKDYPQAEIAAKNALEIADDCGFGLMDDYTEMMSYESQPNKEFILTINFLPNDVSGLSNRMTVQRIVRDAPYFIQDQFMGRGWGYAVPTRDLYDAFEPGDPRRIASMWAPGDFYCIHHGEQQVYTNDTTHITYTYNDGDTIRYQRGWSVSNLNTRKVVHSILGLGYVENDGYDVPILRYAELYLYYAEALIENGKIDEGMNQINKVRARPSVNMPALTASDQTDARTKLRHERRVELNMEGIRIFDLLRWGIAEEIFGQGPDSPKVLARWGDDVTYKGTVCEFPKNYVLPIPQQEIDLNTLMVQNTGY